MKDARIVLARGGALDWSCERPIPALSASDPLTPPVRVSARAVLCHVAAANSNGRDFSLRLPTALCWPTVPALRHKHQRTVSAHSIRDAADWRSGDGPAVVDCLRRDAHSNDRCAGRCCAAASARAIAPLGPLTRHRIEAHRRAASMRSRVSGTQTDVALHPCVRVHSERGRVTPGQQQRHTVAAFVAAPIDRSEPTLPFRESPTQRE